MARVLLVRHGQSEWNAAGRWQGQADPALTELGVLQAQHAAMAIGTVDAIAASPLDRAHRTASILATSVGIEPVLVLDGLMERSAGEWEGLTRDEIDQGYPGYLDRGDRPTGWESDDHLLNRVMGALDALAEVVGDDAQVVTVTHGGVIMCLERSLGVESGRIANLGARWIEQRDGRWVPGDRMNLVPEDELTIPNQI